MLSKRGFSIFEMVGDYGIRSPHDGRLFDLLSDAIQKAKTIVRLWYKRHHWIEDWSEYHVVVCAEDYGYYEAHGEAGTEICIVTNSRIIFGDEMRMLIREWYEG